MFNFTILKIRFQLQYTSLFTIIQIKTMFKKILFLREFLLQKIFVHSNFYDFVWRYLLSWDKPNMIFLETSFKDISCWNCDDCLKNLKTHKNQKYHKTNLTVLLSIFWIKNLSIYRFLKSRRNNFQKYEFVL
jgi:hypothetical protein